MTINKTLAATTLLLIILGCNAQSNSNQNIAKVTQKPATTPSNPCLRLSEHKEITNKDVLTGTEISDTSKFTPSSKLSERYQADMGGATLNLDIEKTDNGFRLTRSYQEPGMASKLKSYASVCIKNNIILHHGLTGRIVKSGLLLIENQPENEFIPSDLWIHYKTK